MKPDIDIKRILASALEAALEDERLQPPPSHRGHGDDRGHRGLKALAIGAAPFAAGAALVTAARAGRKHLPLPARMVVSKLPAVPKVGDIAETARDRVADGADALRDRFMDHDDAEAPDEADGENEDSGDDLADEILADAHEQSQDRPQGDAPRDEDSDEIPQDEGSDEIRQDEGADETENDERAPREPPDLVLEMNRGSGEDTPDLFEALSERHPRPPVMQALNRRAKQAAKSD